jgi:uncharacterized membrane protein YccC
MLAMWKLPGGKRLGEPELWQAARLLSSIALAYGSASLLRLPDPFWAGVTAVVVTQPVLGAALTAGRDRILGTLLGALAGLLVIVGGRQGLPLMPMFWIALVPLAVLTAIWANLRMSCITLIVVLLVPPLGLSFARPLDRIIEILLGTLTSIAVTAALRGRGRPE